MLAILALVAFVLAAFGVNLAGLNLMAVGLALLAAHFIVPTAYAMPWRRNQP